MMTSTEIRQLFFDFFAAKGHKIVPSAPIVIKNDPTLMFTNAGMNQFKDYFLGNKQPPFPRVANSQKCLRVSGKHNDLEEVGVDTYHHTMFEMLGNWSFGDYFKDEAIAWSWELLTEVYQLDKSRLYVTVFEGDEREGLPPSKIALAKWQKLVAPDHILMGNKKDNFWEMGDTGPCGPCSEIHVDMRPDAERALLPGSELVNKDHPQVIEIWNNVFIQYNRKKDGTLEELPSKHVDTGMGFERLVRVLQNKTSNYDTDIFTHTLGAIEKIVHKEYQPGATASDGERWKEAIAFRVLADHIRAISFTIADGQLPSNTGAGYVIRRILRRAVRYYYSYLGYHQPLLHQLVPVIAAQFEHVFGELKQQEDFVQKVVFEEEHAFLHTLDKGLKRIQELIQLHPDMIPGDKAFELYDTYGFPLDLTHLIAQENNSEVDEIGFKKAMQLQKERSRAATNINAGDWIIVADEEGNQFVGYEQLESNAKLLKYRLVEAKGKKHYQLVLSQTPFYPEGGGQIGDTGLLHFGNEAIEVTGTKRDNNLIIHFTENLPNNLTTDIDAVVNKAIRFATAKHHSVTHLLHAALRTVLGTHVTQKGSLVNSQSLRFDFSHFAKMTKEEIKTVEQLVNQKIRENIPVQILQLPKEEALAMGAMALFGEKYGDLVRVVVMDKNFSVELCGGTHVTATGDLGFFKITHETAVAAGVRRLEAVVGEAAELYIDHISEHYNDVLLSLKQPKDAVKAIEAILEENITLKKHVEYLEARQLVGIRNELLKKDEIINQLNFIGDVVEVSNPDALKKLCLDLKNHLKDFVVVLGANIGGKPYVAISIADNVIAARGLDANGLIKQHIAPLIKGGGGGQKNLATAGGQEVAGLAPSINAIRAIITGLEIN